jgi:hypothetical protein
MFLHAMMFKSHIWLTISFKKKKNDMTHAQPGWKSHGDASGKALIVSPPGTH